MISKVKSWSLAHTNYETIKEKMSYASSSFNSDVGWLKYFVSETPNGSLFQDNVLYDVLSSQKVYLAHITTNLSAILEDGRLLSSSGCLIGSVYSTPLIKEGESFRLHNLGEYILLKEAAVFSKNKNVTPLLIELEFSKQINHPVVGVDYLRLGQVHFHIFSELNYLLSHHELNKLNLATITSIRKISNLLIIIGEHDTKEISRNFSRFYKLYLQAINDSPILGYILFEVVCEYIALFQKGEQVERYKDKREFYCKNFKSILFNICPEITSSFNLGFFRPELNKLKGYISTIEISNNSKISFENFLLERLCYLISKCFYDADSDAASKKYFWENIEWNIPYLQNQLEPLLGHTIHRFLRNMKRYPNFYFYFDQYKALQAWNYWNHSSVVLPYNSILPKGELGINPASPDMKHSIYTANFYQKDGFTYLTKDRKIPIIIEPRLAELNRLLMRKKT